jgi:hypothetical protein
VRSQIFGELSDLDESNSGNSSKRRMYSILRTEGYLEASIPIIQELRELYI